MKYRILIRAFTLRRDIGVSYVLAELLRKQGCDVYIACCRNYARMLAKWKPHAVIINTTGAVETTKRISPHTKIIHFPGEGGEAIDGGDIAALKRLGTYDLIDLLLLWGNITQDAMHKNFAGNLDKLKVCGNGRLDLIKFAPPVEKRNTIGFIGRFANLNYYDKRPTIFTLVDPNFLENVRSECTQFVAMCKNIEHIVKSTSLNVSIRPHPLEAPEGYFRLKEEYGERVEIDDTYEFSYWASKQKMMIGTASSGFLEAYLLKIPVITIDKITGADKLTEEKYKLNMMLYDMSYLPTTQEELFELVQKDLTPICNVPSVDSFLRVYENWPYEGSSLAKSAYEIISFLERQKFPSLPHYPKFTLDAHDWYYFWKSTLFGGSNHPNFNYREGYHRIPSHYDQIVDNIIGNKHGI